MAHSLRLTPHSLLLFALFVIIALVVLGILLVLTAMPCSGFVFA